MKNIRLQPTNVSTAEMIPTNSVYSGLDIKQMIKSVKNFNNRNFTVSPKIVKQMKNRGWSKRQIDRTINNPHKKISTKDVRWLSDGSRKNEPATAFIRKDGHYVIRNDKTNDIVQISNLNDCNWKNPF